MTGACGQKAFLKMRCWCWRLGNKEKKRLSIFIPKMDSTALLLHTHRSHLPLNALFRGRLVQHTSPETGRQTKPRSRSQHIELHSKKSPLIIYSSFCLVSVRTFYIYSSFSLSILSSFYTHRQSLLIQNQNGQNPTPRHAWKSADPSVVN